VNILIFFTLCLFMQEVHYVDGTTLILTDGTRIMTLEDVKTDLYNYYWYEDGAYISITKSVIKKVDYFSFREFGRAPKLEVKDIHQRRIRDKSVVYKRGNENHLRVLHVNPAGKSVEGLLLQNRVKTLFFTDEQTDRLYSFSLEQVDKNFLMEFHFYNMKGKRVSTAMVDLDMFPVTRAEARKRKMTGFFRLPKEIEPEHIGLIEVVSSKKSKESNHEE